MPPLPIIGGAVGGVVLIAAACCCLRWRRKRDLQKFHHDVEAPVGTANQGTAAVASSSHAHSVAEDTDPAMAAGVAASLVHASQGRQVRILDFHAACSYTLHTHE